jgi:hypothetical protein
MTPGLFQGFSRIVAGGGRFGGLGPIATLPLQ